MECLLIGRNNLIQKIGLIKLVDLLNKLADENKQLKSELEYYKALVHT